MPVDNEIRGRLALITGASGGIGAACAQDLYSHGVHLALTYSTSKAKVDNLICDLEALASENGTSPRISSHQVDTSSAEQIQNLFSIIEKQHGHGPDILVSNAGYGARISDIMDIPLSEFDKMYTINLRASFILTQACVPHMRAQKWGRIIYISSIAGHGGGINGCHYAASKAGLMGLAKNLGTKGLAEEGITVNDVAPAMIGGTGMIPGEEFVRGTAGDVGMIPVRRLGETKEVANVVTMICRTGYLTGQSVVLSGGLK